MLQQQERQQQRGLRPRKGPTRATETIVNESNIRRENAARRYEGSREAASTITARVVASIEEGIVAVSPQRPSFRREEVMEILESIT